MKSLIFVLIGLFTFNLRAEIPDPPTMTDVLDATMADSRVAEILQQEYPLSPGIRRPELIAVNLEQKALGGLHFAYTVKLTNLHPVATGRYHQDGVVCVLTVELESILSLVPSLVPLDLVPRYVFEVQSLSQRCSPTDDWLEHYYHDDYYTPFWRK